MILGGSGYLGGLNGMEDTRDIGTECRYSQELKIIQFTRD